MNTSHLSSDERIERIIERALYEAKRKNRGPIYHLLARLFELDSDIDGYIDVVRVDNRTTQYADGVRGGLLFAVALVMKYRHRTPGIMPGEADVALRRLVKAKTFARLKTENLPVAA